MAKKLTAYYTPKMARCVPRNCNNVMIPNLVHSRVARNGKMCAQELPIMFCFQIWLIPELPGMAKSGNVTVSNLAHSGVARNGNGVCPRIPKSGNNVVFPNLALSMKLPGMAKGGNVYVSKYGSFQFPIVAIMFCFQIWLFPWSCQECPKLVYVSLELPGMAMVCAQEFPKVAIKYYKEKRK